MISREQVREGLDLFRQKIKDNDSNAEKAGIAALQDAVALGEKALIIDVYIELTGFYYAQKLDYLKSLEYAKLTEAYLDAGEANELQTAQIFKQLATAYFELREFTTSIGYYKKGVEHIEAIAEPSEELQIQLAGFYFSMSNFYLRLNMFQIAQGYAEHALQLAEKCGDARTLMMAHIHFANCLQCFSRYADALAIYLEVLATYRSQMTTEMQAVVHAHIGFMYIQLDRDDTAEPYLVESLAIRKGGAQRHREAYSYYTLLPLYQRLGDREKVAAMAAELQALVAEYSNVYGAQMCHKMMAETYACLGDYQKAYEYKNKIAVPHVDASLIDTTIAGIFQAELAKQEKTKDEADKLQKLNRDMQQYSRQLEYSNTDLKSYAHTTSHDLREPLRMISTYMSVLEAKLQDKLNDDEKQFMHFAVDGAKRMDDMITRILDSAKSQDVAMQPVSLARVAERTAANLTKLLSDKRARFTYDPLPMVMGDEILWLQVIQNLVTNAVKYNSSGAPLVHISFIKATDKVTLSISDNGVGIPAESREKVFEIYSRVENPTGEDGTGIGLSTVKRNIERMKGRIWIEGNEPNGSIFKIEVPAL